MYQDSPDNTLVNRAAGAIFFSDIRVAYSNFSNCHRVGIPWHFQLAQTALTVTMSTRSPHHDNIGCRILSNSSRPLDKFMFRTTDDHGPAIYPTRLILSGTCYRQNNSGKRLVISYSGREKASSKKRKRTTAQTAEGSVICKVIVVSHRTVTYKWFRTKLNVPLPKICRSKQSPILLS